MFSSAAWRLLGTTCRVMTMPSKQWNARPAKKKKTDTQKSLRAPWHLFRDEEPSVSGRASLWLWIMIIIPGRDLKWNAHCYANRLTGHKWIVAGNALPLPLKLPTADVRETPLTAYNPTSFIIRGVCELRRRRKSKKQITDGFSRWAAPLEVFITEMEVYRKTPQSCHRAP